MRPTLHEYNLQKLSDLDCTAISDVLNFTKLTNRAPRLGDFVPCDLSGNPTPKPDMDKVPDMPPELQSEYWEEWNREYDMSLSKVIFAGDWEVVKGSNSNHTRIYCEQLHKTIDFELSGVSAIRTDSIGFVLERGVVDRIEELPREIEFKDGVI